MDKSIIEIVEKREIFVDASSLMCGQKDFLMLDLFDLLIKNNKKVYVLKSAKELLSNNENYLEKQKNSSDGLYVLKQFEDNNLIDYIDSFDLIFKSNYPKQVCLFIENKNKLKVFLKQNANSSIEFYKLGDGRPVKWDFYNEKEGILNMSTNTKLLISFVVDNSSSMKGDKIEKLKKAISAFADKMNTQNYSNRVEYSIISFRGFDSVQFKSFDQSNVNINNLYAGGIPFCSNAIDNSISSLTKRVELGNKNGESLYKPWVILLLNGENYDDIKDSAVKIVDMIKAGKISYFPFALSDNEFDPNLALLKKIKPFTTVKDSMYDYLFEWIYNLVEKRVNTPVEQSFSIDPKSFEGWTIK